MNTNKPTHTPGPWKVGRDGERYVYPEGRQGTHEPIAFITGHDAVDSESAANARLIAAAPDMKDDLQAALDEFDSLVESDLIPAEELIEIRTRLRNRIKAVA